MMPSKKKKYNARFPAGRIKKIMQTDEDVGKVAQAVPVIISRALELFVESLLTKAVEITNARSAKTLTPSHMRQCILSESRFDFLKDLVINIPEVSASEEDIAPSNAGQVAPKYFQSVKKERERTPRGRGRGRGASRTDSSRKSSTSSLPGTSPWARRLTPPTTPTPKPPLFYREISTDLENQDETGRGALTRPPVIQHTGPSNHRPRPDNSGDEEEDEEEEKSNGYDLMANHTTPVFIDDDYDT